LKLRAAGLKEKQEWMSSARAIEVFLLLEPENRDLKVELAEVLDLPGVMAYGDTRDQAVVKAEALALRVIADRIDHGESIPELDDLFVVSA
jgi:predicted RNase H-like HicB family nuclease